MMHAPPNEPIVFRTKRGAFLMWYVLAFCIVGGLGALLLIHQDDVPLAVLLFFSFLMGAALVLPLVMLGGRVAISKDGVLQRFPLASSGSWSVRWDEIEDWSGVEIAVGGTAVHWESHIYLVVEGQVLETNPWIVGREEAEIVAAEILKYRGPPKNAQDPVLPKSSCGTAVRWRSISGAI